MLKRVVIENYALIRALDIRFQSGFTTITGETGAGKSIMLDALGMVLGNRADMRVISEGGKKCIVEATFSIREYGLEPLFSAHDIDYDHETLLRREINANGKSRAFVNDTPVNLAVLKELGSRLINIHSQHEVLVLNNRDFQLTTLDTFDGNEPLLQKYQVLYQQYTDRKKRLEELSKARADYLAQYDYDRFLYDELVAAKPENDRMEELEEGYRMLTHAAEIKALLYQLAELMTGEPILFTDSLKTLTMKLQKYASGEPLNDLIQRLESLCIEANDLAMELEQVNNTLDDNPQEAEKLNERIGHLNHLMNKHRVQSTESLVMIRDEIGQRLSQQHDLGEVIEKTAEELEELRRDLEKLASEISLTRSKAAAPLAKHLTGLLTKLGMPDATIQINTEQLPQPGPDGMDTVSMLFSANKGSNPDIISRIASGGELSRLMLALKSVLSKRTLIPTIIFDEIDSGVSGDIAGKTGNLMKQMGDTMQVIAITHLPQIAAKGDLQFQATKSTVGDQTVSQVVPLSEKQRVDTIARMLSDGEPTNESLANAKQLLGVKA